MLSRNTSPLELPSDASVQADCTVLAEGAVQQAGIPAKQIHPCERFKIPKYKQYCIPRLTFRLDFDCHVPHAHALSAPYSFIWQSMSTERTDLAKRAPGPRHGCVDAITTDKFDAQATPCLKSPGDSNSQMDILDTYACTITPCQGAHKETMQLSRQCPGSCQIAPGTATPRSS